MARKRSAIQADGSEPIQFAPPDPDGATPNRSNDRRTRKRITVYLKDDGSPDLDDLDADSKSKLGIGATTAADAEPVEPAKEPVSPEAAGMLIGLFVGIESTLIATKTHLPQQQVFEILNPNEKMSAALNERTAKVLTKYSGSLGRWEDELMLGAAIVSWQMMAFAQLRQLIDYKQRAEAETAKQARDAAQQPRPADNPSQQAA